MRLVHVVGTRPNFVKMAPVIAALRERVPDGRARRSSTPASTTTGRCRRSSSRSSACPSPTTCSASAPAPTPSRPRGCSSGSSRCCATSAPDLVLVPATSTRRSPRRSPRRKLGIPVGHVEAGLRSFDRDDARGDQPDRHRPALGPALPALAGGRATNLRARGSTTARMQFVGNTMIDTLVALEDRFRDRERRAPARARAGLLPARHAAPPGARRRAAARRRRSTALARGRRARCRSSSRSIRGPGRCSAARDAPARPAADRPGRLPRLPLARGRRRRGAHRLRRHPGGDDLPRRSVLHAARQHRAPGHGPRRDQHAARPRPGADRRDPGAARRPSRGRRRSGTAAAAPPRSRRTHGTADAARARRRCRSRSW